MRIITQSDLGGGRINSYIVGCKFIIVNNFRSTN